MYADGGARGGVLEPEGMVEIKFRTPELRAAMARIDPVIRQLKVETFCCIPRLIALTRYDPPCDMQASSRSDRS